MRNAEFGIKFVGGRAIADRPYRGVGKYGVEASGAALSVSASADSSPKGGAKPSLSPRRGASVMRRDPKGKPILYAHTGWVSKGSKTLRGDS